MSDDDESRNPLEHALDVFVFLPVGFVLDFPRSMPRYIERGRQHFEVARKIGRQSLTNPPLDPGRSIERVQAHTRNTLRALGVVPPLPPDEPDDQVGDRSDLGAGPVVDRGRSSASVDPRAAAGGSGPVGATVIRPMFPASGEPAGSNGAAAPAPGADEQVAGAPESAPTDPGDPTAGEGRGAGVVGADTLAIPDYDSLSASQVVPRLDSLNPAELETVRQYEVTNRGRKTILNKVAQLQAG